MSHGHCHAGPCHGHAGAVTGRYLGLAIGLTAAFVVGEAVAGLFAQSLALLSDAAHNFADALALVFSWYALRMASRPADARRTYGYHRVTILAALANAVSLVVIALGLFWEAGQRLLAPVPVEGGLMIGVALVAVLLNGAISLFLRGEAKHDLNLRSAYLHMLGDAASAFGVVIAGAVVLATGLSLADPIVSILIAVLILWSSWSVLAEAANVLMEAAPRGLDMAAVERTIGGVPGVRSVHDLHVWTVSSGIVACSCHILVEEQSVRSGQQVLRGVVERLRQRFGISHTTVQVEVEGCEPNDLYCTLRPAGAGAEPGHRHP